jgi:hypothetical protein
MLPGLNTSDKLVKDLHLFQTKEPEMIRLREEPDLLEATLDTAQYRPDELEVNVEEGGQLVVQGSHQEKSGDQRTSRQFKKRYAKFRISF